MVWEINRPVSYGERWKSRARNEVDFSRYITPDKLFLLSPVADPEPAARKAGATSSGYPRVFEMHAGEESDSDDDRGPEEAAFFACAGMTENSQGWGGRE